MPKLLTPEEYEAEFGGGFRAEAPRAGLGTRLGASVDRAQAGLLGIGEAVGLPFGDMRRANQFENQESMGRFFRDNPDEPQSFRDVDGIGSAGRYVRGLAIDFAPELATSLATGGAGALMGLGTAGRVGLAASANYPAAVGDILQNQREESGRTNAGAAALLGVPYAAADLVGLDAALAGGRMARTGIKRLDDMQGFRGGLARTGANVALNAPIEGASETFQEGINQLGRIAVNPNQTLFNEDANERYLDSFIGGAALGGSASAALGGWRRSAGAQPRTVDEGQFDLTGNGNRALAPQYNLTTEMDPLQGRINQNLGLQRTPMRDYEKQFLEAYNAPSGRFVSDPQTGVERELTSGELQQMQLGELKAQEEATTQREQQIAQETLLETSKALGVTPVATMENAFDVLGARVYGQPQVAKLVQEVAVLNSQLPPEQQQLNAAILGANLVNFSGKTGIPTAQKIGNAINGKIKQLQLEGVESIERAAEILNDQVATLVAAGKNEGDAKLGQIATVYEKLTGQAPPALGGKTAAAPANTTPVVEKQQPKFQRAPAPQGQTNGQPSAPVAAAASSVDGRSPVVSGGVVDTGRDAAVNQGVGGNAGNPGAAAQQARVVPNANVQQPAAVEIDPTQYAEDEDAVEIAKLTGQGNVATAIEEEAAGERRDREDLQAGEIDAVLTRRFAKSEDPARDRRIFEAFLTATKYAPYGSVAKVKNAVGSDFGVEEKMVDKIGNPKELVRVGAELGFSQEQIEQAFGITVKRGGKPKADADEDTQTDEDAARAARDEAENAEEPVMGSFVDPDEDSGLSADGGGRASEKDMASGLTEAGFDGEGGFGLDNSRFWQKASSSGNKAAAPLLKIAETVDGLRQSIAELEAQGLTNAVASLRDAIADQQEKLDALLKAAAPAPVVPKREVGADLAAAKEKFKSVDRDVTKMERAELELLRGEAERFKNKELLAKIDAQLGNAPAAEEAAPAAEPVAEKPAPKKAEPKKAEATVATAPKQDSGQALWDSLRKTSPDLVAYDDLTDNERGYLTELADRTNGKPKLKDELGLQELMGRTTDMKFGKDTDGIKDAKAKNPYTAKELLAELKDFIRADIPGRKLLVVDSIEDLLRSPDKMVRAVGAGIALEGAYGVAVNGRGYLIANRIQKGAGRAKFMHEVGAHLGLEKLLPKAQYDKLTQQIVDWAKKDDGSTESELALNAVERVQNAGTPKEDRRSELLAYFIEEAMEAGIDPTADGKMSGPLRDWFRTLWAAFKTAVRKLGFKPESMTAQDVVNLAFGAARLEINGTWHGTAAAFRKFSNEFMGTGEGAQAYGWGTYLAQRTGIAKGYWSADVDRKTGSPTATYDGRPIEELMAELDAKEFDGSGLTADQEALRLVLMDLSLNLGVGDNNALRSTNMNIAKRGASGSLTSRTYKQASDWLDKNYSKFKVVPGKKPEGSLMRIDTAVTADETLDWDRPLSEQPAVLEKLGMLMPQGLQEALAAQYEQNVEDIGELSGEDLYRGLRFLEKSEGLVSEFWGTDEYVGQPGKKVASLFLDSMGIKGIQFLDAKSRGASGDVEVDGKSLWGTINGDAWAAMVDSKGDIDAAIAELKKQESGFNPVYADNATEGIQQLEALRGQDVQYKAKVRTRNLVVFDDKNIFRVGSEVAADPQRMKFGKNASSVPTSVKPQVNLITRTLRTGADAALNKIIFSEDLFKRASKMGLRAAMDMDRIYRERAALTGNIEREVTRIENLFNRIPESAKGTGPKSANQFLYDSTRENKWGFTPTWRGKDANKVKVDPAIAQRYNALPKEAQAWVSAVLEHGDKMLKMKKDTLIASTNSEYDALIADAKQRGEANKVARLERDKATSLRQFQRLFATTEFNPYAPMRRFGDFVVIGKSQKYLDATPAERVKLESDPDHYHVSFAESRASALELERQLNEQGSFSEVSARAKEDARGDMYGGLMDAFNKLRGNIESELNNATEPKEIAALRAARETVAELYLQSLAENSARKSEMRRRGVAGEIDMLRSFSTQGRADAHFLASAKFNPQAQETVVKMRQQVKEGGSQLEKSDAFKEIMARHTQSMRYEQGGWFDVASNTSRVTSIWMLATSPMYYLQNLTQPFVLSLPFMTGKHNWTDASGQLMRSYFQLGDLLNSAKLGEGFDFTKVSKDKAEQDMILKLVDRGRIDIGMDTELGKVKLTGENLASKVANRGDQILRSLSQKVEAVNRVSTALAAYRLEIKAGRTPAQALEYADEVISQTHGDYTRINAPRLFNTPGGKVALQFRKFQLIQLTLLAKLVYNSVKGGTKAEKAAARKILAFTLGHTGVLAGVVGLPGFAAAAFIINNLVDAFGDDDEPYNLENELRKMLGGGDVARMVMRGAPTLVGADLSGKLGMGNALSILPYTDFDASREGFNAIATGLAFGATGGLGARVFQGLGDIKNGDYYRGLLGLAPIGVSQALKAFVEAFQGETNKRGDVLVSADEIGTFETFAKAIGFPTSAVAERRFDRQVAFDNKEAFENKSAQLKNAYTKAVRDNDSEARRATIEKWQRLQASRKEAGFTQQPLSSLMKAPQEQAKRERNTAGGVQFNKQNRQFVQEQTAN